MMDGAVSEEALAFAGLHCLTRMGCPADTARKRLASDERIADVERSSLEIEARGCQGPQADPWDKSVTWDGCPAKAAPKHRDVMDTMNVKALASMSPLAGWPRGYSARIVEVWSEIEREKGWVAARVSG